MSCSGVVFHDITSIVTKAIETTEAISPDQKESLKKDVSVRIRAYSTALSHFDVFFSQSPGDFQSEEVSFDAALRSAKESRNEALRLRRILDLSITPKLHCIEDHACNLMELYQGIGEFIERQRQLGLKNQNRSRSLKTDKVKKFTQTSKWEEAGSLIEVQKAKQEVDSKRYLGKRKSGDTKGAQKQAALCNVRPKFKLQSLVTAIPQFNLQPT